MKDLGTVGNRYMSYDVGVQKVEGVRSSPAEIV